MQDRYYKYCPKCNKKQVYKDSTKLKRAINENSSCYSCANIRFRNFKFSESRNNKIASSHLGVKRPHHSKAMMGENNPSKRLDVRNKLRNNIKHLNKAIKGFHPNFNKFACELFDLINQRLHLNGRHALNGGEVFIEELGYWLDFFDSDNNIVIEFYEYAHYSQIDKDVIREKKIKDFLNCTLIILKEGRNGRLEVDVRI